MTTYQVCWTNEDVCADDPLSAAKEAWDMLRDPEAFPPAFEVRTDGETTVEVDLRWTTRSVRPAATSPAAPARTCSSRHTWPPTRTRCPAWTPAPPASYEPTSSARVT